jgi:hypothetical protein
MYDSSDPRSALAKSASAATPAAGAMADAEYGLFYEDPPTSDDANGKTWLCRGQNFIVAYCEAQPGATFARDAQVDEYMVLAPDRDTPLVAEAGAQRETVDGYAVLIMPPGRSRLTLPNGGRVVLLYTTRSADLAAKCANAASYARPHPHIPALTSWPDPPGGFKIRVYSLDVPQAPGRFGRIYRCTTLMLNVPYVNVGPRDLTKVSPHHHDDFEQGSLALSGDWQHHMRWPWGVDMNEWRADVHVAVRAPSLTVIPPPAIHTSTWSAPGDNHLVDVFAPPRVDFSRNRGWVLNEAEYPLPSVSAS